MKATPPEHLDPTAVAKWRSLPRMLDTAQPRRRRRLGSLLHGVEPMDGRRRQG